ncbi:putative ribonuclease H-like domain-containing protein, partial [Tanacetum coccineum]
MGLLVLFNKEQNSKLLVCLLFITGRTQKGNSFIEGSKVDKGYAGRASTIQVTRSLDFSGFTKRYKGDILLVQVYVDDIICGLTKKELCIAFEKLMHEKFQMSSIGELTFFLGLQ